MKYIAVKNFEKFQHYKDRGPKWIKLYNELLDDYAFLALSEPLQRHLLMIWLIASRHENRIPNDPAYLARAIHARGRVDFAPLFDADFLTYTDEPASKTLAEPEQPASTNGAKRSGIAMLEKEGEKEKSKKQPSRSRKRDAAPDAVPITAPPDKPLCDALYRAWVSKVGAVDYGRFRKAIKPLFGEGLPVYTESEWVAGIEAFSEQRDAVRPDKRSFWHAEKFAGDAHEFVRVGKLPTVDEWGVPTERLRLAMGDM